MLILRKKLYKNVVVAYYDPLIVNLYDEVMDGYYEVNFRHGDVMLVYNGYFANPLNCLLVGELFLDKFGVSSELDRLNFESSLKS